MGDTSNFTVWIPKLPDDESAVAQIKDAVDYLTGGTYFEESIEDGQLQLGANEVSLGSVDELDSAFTKLVTEGVPDFPWCINDEPAYEWLGNIVIHVPGLEDFAGTCDANGTVVIDADELVQLVEGAEDLESLKAEVRRRAGTAQIEGLRALRPGVVV